MPNLNAESRIYRLTGLTPILGSLPAIKELRTIYVSQNAPTQALADEEITSAFDVNDRGLTVFTRDKRNQLCVMAYQIKGFFKAALYALSGQFNISAYKAKVDAMLFVEPRYIPLTRDGKPIMSEDDILERPLRSFSPKGERVTLAASEQIDDPWNIEIEISLFPQKKSAKSDALTWDVVEAALDYGAYHGLGQWRNADYGRFLWERIEE